MPNLKAFVRPGLRPAPRTVTLPIRCGLVAAALLIGACDKKEAERPAGMAPIPGAQAPVVAVPPAGSTAPAGPSATPPPTGAPAAQAEADTVPAPPDPKNAIAGTITLPSSRKKDVKKGDTLFVIVRRAGGPPGPASMMAVQKLQVDTFPMPFLVSARDAMIPGTPFDGKVSISVRVDKDGDAMTRRKGDVSGQANDVAVGSRDVAVALDTVQTEDTSLAPRMGGPGMANPHGGLPPGHP